MAAFKAWTWRQLTRLTWWLSGRFSRRFEAAQPGGTGDRWTAETLTRFGLEMGKGFGGGL
ncbi:MAG TPA: hypothetical protein VLS96_21610 [Nodosilinea sp.]|nr:hypothetical protein [Nodosilinea sp.]